MIALRRTARMRLGSRMCLRESRIISPPPRSTLLEVITDEWIRHVFIGALPWAAAMWAWDQCFIQGWHVAVQLCVSCAWLMRRELRCLAAEGANVDDLREVSFGIMPEIHPRCIRDVAEAIRVMDPTRCRHDHSHSPHRAGASHGPWARYDRRAANSSRKPAATCRPAAQARGARAPAGV